MPILWISAGALAVEPSRATTRALLDARGRREQTILDLDYRPSFWASEDEARREIGATLEAVTIAIGNRTECEIAVSASEPDAAADALLERGLAVAVVKLGGDGVLVATPDERQRRPAACRSRSSAGSGRATRSAVRFCHGLLVGMTPVRGGRVRETPPVRSSPRACCAPMRCRPRARSVDVLEQAHAGR